ncbi:ABC transporter ATP-binding protein [Synergistales bacterium]|nr:ABC transporter ATP-binding protein [Synergistales bacterium]
MGYDDEPSGSIGAWRGMIPFFRPFKALLLGISAMMIVCSLVDALVPIYQKYIIDSFIVPGRADGLRTAAVCGVIMISVRMIGTMFFTRLAIKVEMGFSRDLKRACFSRLQTLSLSYYNTTSVGYIISRVMSDTDKIGLMLAWGLVDILWGVSGVIFSVAAMLLLDASLGMWLVATVIPMAFVTGWFQSRILRHNRAARQLNSQITGAFNEGILGARTSKTLVIEDVNISEFSSLTGGMYKESVRAASLSAAYSPIMMMFGSLAVAMIIVRGGAEVMGRAMEIGVLSALVSYSINIFEPIQHLAAIFSEITATQANIERVTALLGERPEITDSPEITAKYGDTFNPKREGWEPIKGNIAFDDVTFKYPDGTEYVLEHFNLTIPAGSCVAIVGETGAGKSTLVNLACRFYEPTSGRILIDGRDIRERSQLWLRSNIGYMLQSPHLFSGSIRDNISYGKLGASDDEIMAAARLVSADEVIEKLPGGLGSEVGEGGDKLSTGEKQLICFARAVISDPRIFILDEATSSIDTEAELAIQRAISKSLEGRTSFLIAHRLSTVKKADLILAVRDGKIIERGTHAELIRQKGYYAKLYHTQFEDGEKV